MCPNKMSAMEYADLIRKGKVELKEHKYQHADNVFIVLAVQRSGHHAIIKWIQNMFPNDNHDVPDVLYNDCGWWTHYTGNRGINKNIAFGMNPHATAYNYWFNNHLYRTLPHLATHQFPSKVHNLMWNFEEFDIKDYQPSIIKLMVHRTVVKYNNLKVVIVNRDPFNLAASRDKGSNGANPLNTEVWKEYARFFLNNHNDDIVCIDYTKWVASLEYKKQKFKELNGEVFVPTVTEITQHGDGSSFDRTAKTITDIGIDNFNKRWQTPVGLKWVKKLIKDKELVILSEQLYGDEFTNNIKTKCKQYVKRSLK